MTAEINGVFTSCCFKISIFGEAQLFNQKTSYVLQMNVAINTGL